MLMVKSKSNNNVNSGQSPIRMK